MSVEKTLKTRISTRAFLDKPVAREELEAILEIARWSPSGGNVQPGAWTSSWAPPETG